MDILIKECYENLANAIITQAVVDYKKALKGNTCRDKYTVKECEEFFGSEYFGILTNVDNETITSRVKREVINEQKHKRETSGTE